MAFKADTHPTRLDNDLLNSRVLLPSHRNDERCREKWVNSLDPDLVFGPFTPEEYALLKRLVDRDGVGNWAEKSLWFPGRTDANLMARWKTGCMSGM
jgi:hypothetical protein